MTAETSPPFLDTRMALQATLASRSTALLTAVTLLSMGNMLGRYWADRAQTVVLAFVLVMASLAATVAARWARRGPAPPVVWVLATGLCAGAMYNEPLAPATTVIVVGLLVTAILVSPRFMFPLAIAGAVTIGITVVSGSTRGSARIDVFTMIQGATGEFIHGHDPYLTAWPVDLFLSGGPRFGSQTLVYGPSVVLLAAPGRLLGDVRFAGAAMWLVIVASTIIIRRRAGFSRSPGPLAVLMIASPLAPSMIFSAWADIYGLSALAAWVALRERHRTLAIIALGLCLSAKPTLGAIFVVVLLWWPEARRDIVPGIGVAVGIVVPFALWDHRFGFWQSTVGTMFNHVLYLNRTDALSLNTAWHAATGMWPPAAILVAVTLALGIPLLATRPRDMSDMFALAAGLTLVIVATNREAFLNYYFVAAVALFLALACEGAEGDGDPMGLCAPVDRALRFVALFRVRTPAWSFLRSIDRRG